LFRHSACILCSSLSRLCCHCQLCHSSARAGLLLIGVMLIVMMKETATWQITSLYLAFLVLGARFPAHFASSSLQSRGDWLRRTGMSEASHSISCPQCGSDRLYRDGWRYLEVGSTVQRFLCRSCGYRFSEHGNSYKEC
jgi:predicted RNA-binding Zn-ribbon protein involved in translation (DUF1610 family)